MRLAAFALCACASSAANAPPATPASTTEPIASSHADVRDANAKPSVHCIVNPRETIIVLDFACDESRCDPKRAAEVTQLVRDEVAATPLPLSPYRAHVVDEELLGGCEAKPNDDGTCRGRIGKRLNTDWLVWGVAGADVVRMQLVPTPAPSTRRTLTFALGQDFAASVHVAWISISGT